jgi:hypothetical protein
MFRLAAYKWGNVNRFIVNKHDMERSCEGRVLVYQFRLSNNEPEVAKFTCT